jgi:hypothetical protein
MKNGPALFAGCAVAAAAVLAAGCAKSNARDETPPPVTRGASND